MLFADEIHLFEKGQVSPAWGEGKNPNHKRFRIITYQMNQKICPHYQDKKCNIYEKRPLICRLFPIDCFPQYIILHKDCNWVQETMRKYPKGISKTSTPENSDEYKAWLELRLRFKNHIAKKKGADSSQWDYNYLTKKWSRKKEDIEAALPYLGLERSAKKMGINSDP
jgi:Fe-S-cluster containining protein